MQQILNHLTVGVSLFASAPFPLKCIDPSNVAHRRVDPFDVELVFKGHGYTVKRANERANLLEVLVKYAGARNGVAKEYLVQAIILKKAAFNSVSSLLVRPCHKDFQTLTSWCATAALLQNAVVIALAVTWPWRIMSTRSEVSRAVILRSCDSSRWSMNWPVSFFDNRVVQSPLARRWESWQECS